MKYRPWGPVEWALYLSSQKPWRLVGAIGTEERSLASWELMKGLGVVDSEHFAEIQDVDSDKYRERTRLALEERRARFAHLGGKAGQVERMELMAELFLVNAFARRAESAATSIVLDITSFPKRFFFPILRKLVKNPIVQNLLVTYTSPASYAPDDEPLYEDIEPWRVLPGFGGIATSGAQWVVSVGF